jgi:hypothetical protein
MMIEHQTCPLPLKGLVTVTTMLKIQAQLIIS